VSEKLPPAGIQEAARKLEGYLNEQATARLSEAEIAKLTPAQRLNYCRRFDQKPCRRGKTLAASRRSL
jgi:hypothetical protein